MNNLLTVIIVILTICLMFLFKFYNVLQIKYFRLLSENNFLKTRIDDLKKYREDVSKTFEILNTDLSVINEHLKQPQTQAQDQQVQESNEIDTLMNEMTNNLLSSVSRSLSTLSN